MKIISVKLITITLSLFILAISLTQNAIKIDYIGVKLIPSINYFLMGSTAILGGAILEQIIWLANPLCLLSIYLLIKNDKNALKYSFLALVLSTSFSTWNEILGAESGVMAKIISLENGYYLWVLSIVVLNLGIILNFKNEYLDKFYRYFKYEI